MLCLTDMSSGDNNSQHKESLMHEINALFAPPTNESYGKKGSLGIPSFRRARKNNESTTNSSETNNSSERLVCDRCPASFHLECLDPPLDPDEAPVGVWFCHRCSMVLKDEEDKTSTSSSQTTIATDTGSSRSGKSGQKRQDHASSSSSVGTTTTAAAVGPSTSTSTSSINSNNNNSHSHQQNPLQQFIQSQTSKHMNKLSSSRSSTWGDSAYVADIEESELRALWKVIEYAKYQNPKEYDLPKDLLPGVKLPGSYKTPTERKNKSIIELENGLIPQPVRRCYVCVRTCFYAPLLPCDYCSSCFHLECLNPPLSHFPPRSDRWMCPNHTEHTTERYLTRSIRLTERMQIWTKLYSSLNNENNHYEQSIDKTDEMTKILEHIPPYELTYTPDEESSILSDLMRTIQRSRNEQQQQQQQHQLLSSNLSNTAMSSIFDSILYTTNNTTTIEDKQHILSNRHIWRLNRELAAKSRNNQNYYGKQIRIVVPKAVKHLYNNPVKRVPRINESSNVYQLTNLLDSSSTDEKSIFVRGLLQFYLQNTLQLPTQSSNLIQSDSSSSSTMITDTSDTIVTTNATQLSISSSLSFETTPITVTTTAIDSQINDNNISSSFVIDNKTTDTLKLTTDSIDMNTGNNSSILPYNTEQISKDPSFIQDDNEHLCNSFEQLNTAIMKKFNNITDNNSIPSKLARLDPQLLYTLAAQRIYDLLGINNENSIFPNGDNIKQNSCKTKKDTSKTLNIPESCIRARAVLTPCDGTNGYETRMHYRQLTVGTSPDCHLCLANYNLSSLNNQKCSFISPHHATIFYDDWTQHYELINYSEYGTRVDGIIYGNDIDRKLIYIPESSDLVHRVRNLIKTAPKELSPNYHTSSVISELCASPPKRLMKMLSKRHEDLSHMTSICDCTSLHFTRNDKFLVDKTDSSLNLITGWEGSAILRHGSVIQFGCYKFIFSLVNHALPSYPSLSSTSTSTWMTMNHSSTQSSSSHESPVLLTDSLSVVTKDFLKLSKNNNLLVH
ncbi:unnamed protein product [Schistosoma mattheei]|uniref:FHA domain-containing protein n=1 Tax=Schistosoma mattheei TaxID=31246 RepID=A0AA85BM28_9TREM|nr:unnamed protein product [Schistosoma mattheei]